MAKRKIEVSIEANENASSKIKKFNEVLGHTSKIADSVASSYDRMTALSNRLQLNTLRLADAQKRLSTETDPMKQAQLRVEMDNLAQTQDNLQREIHESSDAITDMGGRSKDVKVLGLSLTDLRSGIQLVTGAARTMYQVTKQAFDFTEEGASVIQTYKSFDRLGVSLEAMREVSLKTIDDQTLMKATLTLTAGASEMLQEKLLENAPALLKIAKAANAVNPGLGTTAQMYESIATGIKRSSPLILDNLGIVVKIGEANQMYADALGITVEEMTAADKQMAILNATVEAGDRLIEQAGGSVEAYGDAWARLKVEIKNATDAQKANAAEAVKPFMVAAADQLQLSRELERQWGRETHAAAYRSTVYGYGVTRNVRSLKDLENGMRGMAAASARYTAQAEYYAEAQKKIEVTTSDGTVAWDQYTQAVEGSQAASDQLNYENAQDQLAELAKSAEEAQERVDGIQWSTSQNLTEQLETGKEKLGELRDRAGELVTKIEELETVQYKTPKQDEELADLREQFGEINADIDETIEGMREMSAQFILNLIKMKISVDGEITAAEASFMAGYARQEGLIDDLAVRQAGIVTELVDELNEGSMDATEAINAIGDSTDELVTDFTEIDETIVPVFENVNAGFGSASLQALQLAANVKEAQKQIDNMKGKTITLDIKINEHRQTGTTGGGQRDDIEEINQAAGGDYLVSKPTMFIAGEGPTPERALFIPQGRKGFDGAVASQAFGSGGGSTIQELNLYVQGTADAQETARLVMQEFKGRGLMPQMPLR